MKASIFFNELLGETAKAYEKSEIRQKQLAYSVSATALVKRAPVIVGFNWGVKKGESYSPQEEYPADKLFIDIIEDSASLKRTVPYFERFFPAALSGVQTNFCFFRSKKDGDISASDLGLAIPLFEKLIDFLEPCCLISFSSKLRDYLQYKKKIQDEQAKSLNMGKRNLSLLKGNYTLGHSGAGVPFVYLPHPNYPIQNTFRKKAWHFAFGGI